MNNLNMPKLVPIKPTELIRKLKKLGFEGPFPGGRHIHMIKGEMVIPVPFHGGKEIGIGLISTIISEVGITKDEWLKL